MCPNNGYFDIPFAADGDRSAVPDPVQGDGSVSYAQGYGILYSTPVVSGGKNYPRSPSNQILFDVTTAIKQYQEHGFFDFITTAMTTDGNPFPYSKYDVVRFDPGGGKQLYQSLINNNLTDPTDTDNWAALILGNAPNTFFIGDTTGGAANVQTIDDLIPAGFSLVDGTSIICRAGFTNTSALTLNPDGGGAVNVKKNTGAGLASMTGGEWVAGNTGIFVYRTADSCFVLEAGIPALQPSNNLADLASLATALTTLTFGSDSGTYFKIPNPNNTARPWIVIVGNTGVTGTGAQSKVVTLPITFPTAILGAAAVDVGSAAFPWGIGLTSRSTITIFKAAFIPNGTSSNVASGNGSLNYIVIGN